MKPKRINQLFIQCLLLPAFLCCAGLPASAQEVGMHDLKTAIQHLKALKDYSYQTTTTAVFPDGSKDKKQTKVYMDGSHRQLCYITDHQVLLLTNQWAYKADHRNKTVSVFDVRKYNRKYKEALPELEAVFEQNLSAMFLDSVILKSGKLSSATRKGPLTTFTIEFPKTVAIQSVLLVYNHQSGLPESIRVRSAFAAGPGDQARQTVYESVSDHYTAAIPGKVFQTRQYFEVQGGKVVLTQFKQYKVSSIL